MVRGLGVAGLSVTIFNCTVGGGIFRLPGSVYATTETWTPLVYLVCGFLMILIALCFVLVGRQTMETGGPYAYTKQAFGPLAGFISGGLLWILGTFATASVADALISSIATVYPELQSFVLRSLVVAVMMGSLVLMNTRGIKRGFMALSLFTILKLVALGVLIVVGLSQFHFENVMIQQPFHAPTFARTCMMLIFAYMGIESALVPGGEIKNPNRTIPIAVIISIASVTILYLLIQIACQSALGPSLKDHADAPLVYASEAILGSSGKIIVLIGSVFSMLGFLMGMMLAIPRVIYVLSLDGFLPKKLKKVDPVFHTPNIAIILQGIIVSALAISGSFNSLSIFANLSAILLYIFCIVAAAKLYFTDEKYRSKLPIFKTGITMIMVISIGIMSWFLTSIKPKEWISMAAICLVFVAIYAFQLRSKSQEV